MSLMSNKPLSVVFLGTSAFAVPSLQRLATDSAFHILAVITQPDRPVGRNMTLTPPPVKTAAEKLGLTVLQPEKMNAAFPNIAKEVGRPDVLVVVSYGQILSDDVLAWPLVAAINVHASLLPLLRGASPLQHAVLQGLKESGVTVQRMVRELDAGPILAQTALPLDERETFSTLHDKLKDLGALLLTETLKHPLQEKDQDATRATFCRKLTKSDGIANPATMTASHIDRMVRALTPWPGVSIRGNKILGTSLESQPEALTLSCADTTTLFILRIQPPGGTPMSGADFIRGKKTL